MAPVTASGKSMNNNNNNNNNIIYFTVSSEYLD